MWMLKRLAELGVSTKKLLSTYTLRIRVHLEQNAPLWMFSLTEKLSKNIEKVQKMALYIILGKHAHRDYICNLAILNLEPLDERRNKIAKNFASNILKHPVHKQIFNKSSPDLVTGSKFQKAIQQDLRKALSLAKLINKELKHKL